MHASRWPSFRAPASSHTLTVRGAIASCAVAAVAQVSAVPPSLEHVSARLQTRCNQRLRVESEAMMTIGHELERGEFGTSTRVHQLTPTLCRRSSCTLGRLRDHRCVEVTCGGVSRSGAVVGHARHLALHSIALCGACICSQEFARGPCPALPRQAVANMLLTRSRVRAPLAVKASTNTSGAAAAGNGGIHSGSPKPIHEHCQAC